METPGIAHPVILRGQQIELHPLEFASLDALFSIAQDPAIWRLTSVDYSVKENFYPSFTAALRDRDTVQFRAKSNNVPNNVRWRRALEKIGATFEGIHRQDKIEPDGQARDTAFFSIVKAEWPGLKATLAA